MFINCTLHSLLNLTLENFEEAWEVLKLKEKLFRKPLHHLWDAFNLLCLGLDIILHLTGAFELKC